MSNVITLSTWAERKAVGDAHEEQTRRKLQKHGWVVDSWGQGILSKPITAVLRLTNSALRWTPDFIAANGHDICLIDCKGRMSVNSGRHSISHAAVQAHLQLMACVNLPLYYVFDNLTVLSPHDIAALGNGRSTPSGAYYLIPDREGRSFESVFGNREESAIPLRRVA